MSASSTSKWKKYVNRFFWLGTFNTYCWGPWMIGVYSRWICWMGVDCWLAYIHTFETHVSTICIPIMRFSLRSMIVYSGRADAWNHPSEFFFVFYRVTAYHVTWLTVKDTELNLKKAKKNLYYHLIDFHFQPLRLIIFEEGVVQYKGKYGNLKSSLFHISNTQYQNHSNFMWVYIFQLSNGPIYLTKWWPNFSRKNKHTLFLEAWYTDTVVWCHFFFHQQQNQQG